MARLIILFVIIAAVAAISPQLVGDKGYVLISFGQWTIEGSIVSFVILTLITVFAAYLLYCLVRYVFNSFRNVRHGFFARGAQRKQAVMEQALWALINDDMQQVRATLSKGVVDEQWRDFAKAMLAKAHISQAEPDFALNLLDELSDKNRNEPANLWLAVNGEVEILNALRNQCASKKATKHQLALLAKVLLKLGKHKEFAKLSPRLIKAHSFDENEWDWALRAYFDTDNEADLQQRHSDLPKQLRGGAQTHFLRAMVRVGEIAKVQDELKKLLKRHEYSQVLSILSEIEYGNVEEVQKALQAQLKKQPDEPEMLLSLAYIAQSQGEHELASRIFDKVLSQQHRLPHPQRAVQSYRVTKQAEKALLVFDHN
ncbi:heme biosynthesis HemY N-terminal domain-containing protein [Pseudoalteromonas sp. SSDWG2]|uniref:heme biosynthesis HemY N-terminal domain-containing protein n=1 Tax=Pseudoalteromonas sp. SSDWG2 TaxID=3139391 RepID=UPI003BA9BEA6